MATYLAEKMPKDHLRNGRGKASQLQGQVNKFKMLWGKRPGKATQLHFCAPHTLLESVNLFGYTGSVPTLDARSQASPNLVGCPIHPALGIGINVDENKPFDCVRVGQLREDSKIRSSHSSYSLPCSLFPSKMLEFRNVHHAYSSLSTVGCLHSPSYSVS